MTTEIEEYSVGQLARLAGVSVRTLHHYDDIGLLTPAHVRPNGYRLYGRAEVLRLQEILFYRDVGMSLSEVGELLNSTSNAVDRLEQHRDRLKKKATHTARLLTTLDATIAHLKGERDMSLSELYQSFSPEKQAEYEAWLIEAYGPDVADSIAISKAAVEKLPQGLDGLVEQLRVIEENLVAAYETGIASNSREIHPLLEEHRAFIIQMWGQECSPMGLVGLADMYLSHPDFIARYERLSPKFSEWLPSAMMAHAARLRLES